MLGGVGRDGTWCEGVAKVMTEEGGGKVVVVELSIVHRGWMVRGEGLREDSRADGVRVRVVVVVVDLPVWEYACQVRALAHVEIKRGGRIKKVKVEQHIG